jgi:6,7-dimethyl-8-ribityllumazine synthase
VSSQLRIGIAVAEFNQVITSALLEGAMAVLGDHEVVLERVPGAWELPLAAKRLAESGVDAVVAIGAVIEGETDHYRFIATEATRGLMDVMISTGVPLGNAVLTVRHLEHARERSALGPGNKGSEAAEAAIAMARGLS